MPVSLALGLPLSLFLSLSLTLHLPLLTSPPPTPLLAQSLSLSLPPLCPYLCFYSYFFLNPYFCLYLSLSLCLPLPLFSSSLSIVQERENAFTLTRALVAVSGLPKTSTSPAIIKHSLGGESGRGRQLHRSKMARQICFHFNFLFRFLFFSSLLCFLLALSSISNLMTR